MYLISNILKYKISKYRPIQTGMHCDNLWTFIVPEINGLKVEKVASFAEFENAGHPYFLPLNLVN